MYQRWKLRQQRIASPRGESELLRRVQGFLRAAVEALGEFLGRLFGGWRGPTLPAINPNPSTWLFAMKIVAWAGLGIVVLFLAIVGFRAWSTRGARRDAPRVLSRQGVRRALDEGEALAMSSPQWIREAERLAGTKDFRAVYRALYLALLSGLHRGGKIDFRPTRTNWTYVARFGGPPQERQSFHDLTTIFDDVWYGSRPAGPHTIELLRDQVVRLVGKDPNA